jgi:hypothetical protein
MLRRKLFFHQLMHSSGCKTIESPSLQLRYAAHILKYMYIFYYPCNGNYELIYLLLVSISVFILRFILYVCCYWWWMQVPGLMKIRHIGRTTLGSAALFGLFLGAGSLIHCGKSY